MKNNSNMLTNAFLNTISSTIYFFFQWLTTVLAVRLANFDSAGVYSLIISFANIFYFIALFGIRNYQISDVDKHFSDGQYFAARIITAILSAVIFTFALVSLHDTFYRCLCAIIYFIFKLGEAFTEGYFSLLQLREDYRSLAISYIAKGCLPAIAFTGAIFLSGNILIAISGMTITYVICIFVLDIPRLRLMQLGKPLFNGCFNIVKMCFPVMLVSLSTPAMNYITRYAVERELGTYVLGQYTSLSYVIVVLSTFVGAILSVFVPKMGQWKRALQWNVICSFFRYTILAMMVLGVIAVVAGLLLGEFVCIALFGNEILANIDLLVPLIITAIFLMVKTLFSVMLIPLDSRWLLFFGELSGVVLCLFSVTRFTNQWGIQGTNLSYLCGTSLQIIILGCTALGCCLRGSKGISR